MGRFLKSNWNCTCEVVLPVDGDSCEAADGSVSKITIPSWWMIRYDFKSAATFVLYRGMHVCGCTIRAYRERDGVAHVLSYENSPRQANPRADFGAYALGSCVSNNLKFETLSFCVSNSLQPASKSARRCKASAQGIGARHRRKDASRFCVPSSKIKLLGL